MLSCYGIYRGGNHYVSIQLVCTSVNQKMINYSIKKGVDLQHLVMI